MECSSVCVFRQHEVSRQRRYRTSRGHTGLSPDRPRSTCSAASSAPGPMHTFWLARGRRTLRAVRATVLPRPRAQTQGKTDANHSKRDEAMNPQLSRNAQVHRQVTRTARYLAHLTEIDGGAVLSASRFHEGDRCPRRATGRHRSPVTTRWVAAPALRTASLVELMPQRRPHADTFSPGLRCRFGLEPVRCVAQMRLTMRVPMLRPSTLAARLGLVT